MKISDGLTFDDVLLEPAESNVLPSNADVKSNLTKSIGLGIPLLSAAMDTEPESNLAIAMAQQGGIGVIHKNLSPELQSEEVKRVKKFESGMVINPITLTPDMALSEVKNLTKKFGFSGFPVTEEAGGKLVGILTNRDTRFANNPDQLVKELMTAHLDEKPLVTVEEGIKLDEAKVLLHQYRLEKLVVVDEQSRCVGLITVKDIEKAQAYPDACKDQKGRLRVAAATGIGSKGYERAERLVDSEVDLIVVDTAHRHSEGVIEAVKKAVNDGKRELISLPFTKNYSIPYVVTGKYGAANVIIKPAVAGSGVLAGGSVRTVLELSGIQNISAKQLGCDNLLNNARATVVALKSIKNQNIFNKVN